jgi:predicted AlkP superfamily pyrophosphatase or phosphodiesterase
MKKLGMPPVWFLIFLVAFAAPPESPAATNASPRYILFLTADGFRTDYIEWYHPPNLEALIRDGVRVIRATNVFPTLTAPNMTALVSGAYPRTTTVAGNSQYLTEEDRIVDHIRVNKAETIAETLKKAGWKTGAVNHFMLQHRGVDSYISAGYDDAEKTTDAVLAMLFPGGDNPTETQKAPRTFVAAIYGATDHAGHSHGPRSKEVQEAVISIDTAIGRLIEGLKAHGTFDQTLITLNADHGMSAYEAKEVSSEPSKALKAAGFKVATSQATLQPDTEVIVLDAGVRMIYLRKLPAERKAQVIKVLSAITGAEILDRAKLDALGCHDNHSGDLIVSPLPGYTMAHAGRNGGLHGRFTERNPILFFHGPGIKKGETVEAANTVDVVPTLLKIAGVPPAKTVEGKAIMGALLNQ